MNFSERGAGQTANSALPGARLRPMAITGPLNTPPDLPRSMGHARPAMLLVLLLALQTAAPPAWTERGSAASDGPAVVISAVHPGGGPDWEVVVLENRGDAVAPLGGCALTDGEGVWHLPEGACVPAGSRSHVAVNATAHAVLFGRGPDVLATRTGAFGLADAGDDVALLAEDGRVLDSVRYGDCDETPGGWLGPPVATPSRMPWGRLLARGPGPDTDCADDWLGLDSPYCGSMEPWEPAEGWEGGAACFVTPEEGLGQVAAAIASARHRVVGAVYRLTSPEVASALAARARAGVRVELLVEGRPVGATAAELERRDGLLAALSAEGAVVHQTFTTEPRERVQPYLYHHAKYLVVDGLTSVVSTENWVSSSFPPDGGALGGGTRGWGAVIECAPLAQMLEAVHAHDMQRCSLPWDASDAMPTPLPAPPAGRSHGMAPAVATLLVAPEGLGEGLSGFLGALGRARATVDVALADLEVLWDDAPSPLVTALLAASARGARVRVLVEPGADGEGRRTVERLLLLASSAGARSLRAANFGEVGGAARLHAKGAIVDGRHVLLGSMNWVRAAMLRNREVGVALDSPSAAARLSSAFEADWCSSVAAAPPGPPLHLLEVLLDGWTPRAGPLPAPPPGRGRGAEDARDWTQVWRALLVLSAGLGAWALDRRYRLVRRGRRMVRVAISVANERLRPRVRPARPPCPVEGPPPTPCPPQGGPGPPQGWSLEERW